MLQADYSHHKLHFRAPAGTSRGVLQEKDTWYIRIYDPTQPHVVGIGECALFKGLSLENPLAYEQQLAHVCRSINQLETIDLSPWSSILFGVETALADLAMGGRRTPFPSPFTQGAEAVEINGLVWMGNRSEMEQRIAEKLEQGFRCIKLKIGAIDFEAELSLLQAIRNRFSSREVELRVDANGAFSPREVMQKLDKLARYEIHSIEQPIAQGNWQAMVEVCRHTPIPIALDEELIGVQSAQKQELIETIRPQYLIFKPSLCGGFASTREWIALCEAERIGWWVTSALESNIGLNAIAQFTATLDTTLPQGLGTGGLYTNNIPSPLEQVGSKLRYNPNGVWDLTQCHFEPID